MSSTDSTAFEGEMTFKGPIVARAGTYYRNARFLMVAMVIGFAGYFLYDGYIGYPKANDEFLAKPENRDKDGKIVGKKPHSDTDLKTQQALGWVLIPAGLGYLAYFMHKSRGEIRLLEGERLQIPGHPDIMLSEITALDKRLWDRKGIANIEYETSAGVKGRARLDDFIYDRKPIDEIYDAIVKNLEGRIEQTGAGET